jgi:hypothetical protein
MNDLKMCHCAALSKQEFRFSSSVRPTQPGIEKNFLRKSQGVFVHRRTVPLHTAGSAKRKGVSGLETNGSNNWR